jgi:hypothetical protein
MSLERSGLVDLYKIAGGRAPGGPGAQAPGNRADLLRPRPLRLTDFSSGLRPFLSLRPENEIRDACTHHKRFFWICIGC